MVGQDINSVKSDWLAKAARPFLWVRQQRTATQAKMGDSGTQEVERHMGDSSIGPTLRTEGGRERERERERDQCGGEASIVFMLQRFKTFVYNIEQNLTLIYPPYRPVKWIHLYITDG